MRNNRLSVVDQSTERGHELSPIFNSWSFNLDGHCSPRKRWMRAGNERVTNATKSTAQPDPLSGV